MGLGGAIYSLSLFSLIFFVDLIINKTNQCAISDSTRSTFKFSITNKPISKILTELIEGQKACKMMYHSTAPAFKENMGVAADRNGKYM